MKRVQRKRTTDLSMRGSKSAFLTVVGLVILKPDTERAHKMKRNEKERDRGI